MEPAAEAARPPLRDPRRPGRRTRTPATDSAAVEPPPRRARPRPARLIGDPNGVHLQTPDGKVETASDWTTLTSRGLGWALPVEGLAFWIQGAPRKDAPFTAEAGDDGAPGVLRQDGWTIVYQAFVKDATGVSRPARMTLDYPGVELRLVIDAWQ